MAKECNNSSCDKSSCEGCASKGKSNPQDFLVPANIFSDVKHVIGVVSGKGGVGKSFVTGSLANAMAAKGYKVGILDADITGPSIPKMYGLTGAAQADDNGIYPMETANGIKVMSINLLLEHDTDPVIWRGSLIAGTVKQFWTDVCWGDVDCLYVDMPPGTGDVPLTVFQSLPVAGVVVVTSPQELVGMIVDKAVNMADMMHVPVLGIVENMAYYTCPDCGKRLYPFGEGRTADVAKQYGLPMLAQLPIQPELAKKCDEGRLMDIQLPEMGKAVDAVLKCKVRKHE